MSATAATTRFESVVRAKLIQNAIEGKHPDSIRGLSRVMGKGDPVRSETFKRSLFKWMAAGDPKPSAVSKALVADALGIDPRELDEDDDEESDPVARLMSALRRVVREELKGAQA